MEEVKLDVQIRNEIGSRKIRQIRAQDFLPAIVYGEDSQPTPIKLERRGFERILRQHSGESLVFHINVLDGEKKLLDYSAVIAEEQVDPVTDQVTHVDFKRISLKKEIQVSVQVVAKGDPIGVKRDGGSLEHVLWELDIICLPMNIPHHIEVQVDALEIGDSIHVKDILLPAGVRTKHDPESIVLTIAPPMKEELEAKTAEGEPEIIKKEGKAEVAGKEESKAPAAESAKQEKKEGREQQSK